MGFRDGIMDNQLEKNMAHEMKEGLHVGYLKSLCNVGKQKAQDL